MQTITNEQTLIAQVPPSDRFLRLTAVMEMTGRSRTSTLDDVRAGKFPQPVKLGGVTVWLESEVQAWMAERVRQARGAA